MKLSIVRGNVSGHNAREVLESFNYLEIYTDMLDRRILDFDEQAEQLLQIIETRLAIGERDIAKQYLAFKFQSLYEQGVSNGRRYEKEGVYPY